MIDIAQDLLVQIVLIFGGSITAVGLLVVVPLVLRAFGKLKRLIQSKDDQINKLKGIEQAVRTFSNDLADIKELVNRKVDYSELITGVIETRIANELSMPVNIMQQYVADMQRQMSVVEERAEAMAQAMRMTWGIHPEVGKAVTELMTTSPTAPALYKPEYTINTHKELVIRQYGETAESVLAGVQEEVETVATLKIPNVKYVVTDNTTAGGDNEQKH
jgi:hypothetical protein